MNSKEKRNILMSKTNQRINEWLLENSIPCIENLELRNKSWLKAGGIIKFFITPISEDQCKKIVLYFSKNKINFYVLGNISNVILRDGLISTPIINLSKLNEIKILSSQNNLKLNVECGVPIPRFANFVIKQGFKGTEGLLGIPGTVGGGIYMNASSYGNNLSDCLLNVKVIDEKGNIIELNKKDLNFTWRKSILHEKKLIAINCIFDFPSNNRVDVKEIQNKSKKIMIHRKTFQESDLPNLGSIFATKNIYKELSKINIYFFLLYLINKVGTFITFKFFKSKIRNYRKKIVSLYAKSLNLEKFKKFSVSEKTLNCLINKGSSEASEAIELLKLLESKTKHIVKMENIILDQID